MKQTIYLCLLTALLAFGLSGCGEEQKTAPEQGLTSPAPAAAAASLPPVTEKDLLHRRFVLKSADGEDYAHKERRPELEFNEGFRISGGICNRFHGQASLSGNTLVAEKLAMTRMLCVDEDLNRLEQRFGALLDKGAALTLEGETLTLKGDDLEMVFELQDRVQ